MFNYDYTVSVSDVFCSSVQIETATGPCQQPHGYTYQVCVHLKAPYVNTNTWEVDYLELQNTVSALCHQLDHTHLNDHPDFQKYPPTCENLGKWFLQSLRSTLGLLDTISLKIDLSPKPGCLISVEESVK